MSEQRVEIKNIHGETLVGVEVIPDRSKLKYPAVILAHGFAYQKEEDGMFVEIAKRLAGIGVACYYFDFSGCGESEGTYADTTLTKLKDDLGKVFEYVNSRNYVDADSIGILGQSFGTTVSIALAPKIKALVLMGSFLNGKKIISDLYGEGFNPDGVSTRTRDGEEIKMNAGFWKDFDNYDMEAKLKELHCSLLLIHGSVDDHVPILAMEEIYEKANEPKEKIIIEGADHGLDPKREDVYGIVTDWFRKTLTSYH